MFKDTPKSHPRSSGGSVGSSRTCSEVGLPPDFISFGFINLGGPLRTIFKLSI